MDESRREMVHHAKWRAAGPDALYSLINPRSTFSKGFQLKRWGKEIMKETDGLQESPREKWRPREREKQRMRERERELEREFEWSLSLVLVPSWGCPSFRTETGAKESLCRCLQSHWLFRGRILSVSTARCLGGLFPNDTMKNKRNLGKL